MKYNATDISRQEKSAFRRKPLKITARARGSQPRRRSLDRRNARIACTPGETVIMRMRHPRIEPGERHRCNAFELFSKWLFDTNNATTPSSRKLVNSQIPKIPNCTSHRRLSFVIYPNGVHTNATCKWTTQESYE